MTDNDPMIPGIKIRTAEHGPLKTFLLSAAIGAMALAALSAGDPFEKDAQVPDVPANISQVNQ